MVISRITGQKSVLNKHLTMPTSGKMRLKAMHIPFKILHMKLKFKFLPIFPLIIFSSMVLIHCHSTREASKGEALSTRSAGENFEKFYVRFHKDSAFQVSRTRFPLGGMSIEGSIKTKWTRNNLPLMRIKVYDIDTTQYKVFFEKTERTFTQKVWIENSGFSSECRFELIGNKWYLVYVLDQNL